METKKRYSLENKNADYCIWDNQLNKAVDVTMSDLVRLLNAYEDKLSAKKDEVILKMFNKAKLL